MQNVAPKNWRRPGSEQAGSAHPRLLFRMGNSGVPKTIRTKIARGRNRNMCCIAMGEIRATMAIISVTTNPNATECPHVQHSSVTIHGIQIGITYRSSSHMQLLSMTWGECRDALIQQRDNAHALNCCLRTNTHKQTRNFEGFVGRLVRRAINYISD